MSSSSVLTKLQHLALKKFLSTLCEQTLVKDSFSEKPHGNPQADMTFSYVAQVNLK